MTKEQFKKRLKNEKEVMSEKQAEILNTLAKEFDLKPMDKPYEYVKELQESFDYSKIQYSDEYYDILGLTRE